MPLWAIRIGAYALAAAAVAWALHAGYSSIWQRGYDAKTAEVTLQATKDERTAAIAALAREAEVRAIEVANDAKMRNVEAEWAKRMTDAQDAADRTVADLAADRIRLRDHWNGCIATSALATAAERDARAHDLAVLRRESASRIVRLGDECDARITALQSAIRVMQGQ